MRRMTRNLLVALAAHASLVHADDTTVRAAVDADGVQRVAIVGGSYFFHPDHVIVKAGKPVELTVSAESGMITHNFVIDAPEAGIAVRAELSTTPQTYRFTPLRPGRFAYYCTHRLLFFKSHRARGMEGVLEIEGMP